MTAQCDRPGCTNRVRQKANRYCSMECYRLAKIGTVGPNAGRTFPKATACRRGHWLTPANTYTRVLRSGRIERTCRHCHRLREQEYKAKRKDGELVSGRRRWQNQETIVGRIMGGKRIPNNGFGQPDVEHEMFSIQVKTFKRIPAWFGGFWKQTATDAKTINKLPLLVLCHAPGQGIAVERYAVMNLNDLAGVLDWAGVDESWADWYRREVAGYNPDEVIG